MTDDDILIEENPTPPVEGSPMPEVKTDPVPEDAFEGASLDSKWTRRNRTDDGEPEAGIAENGGDAA